MRKIDTGIKIGMLVVSCFLMLDVCKPAYAYLDPGAGSVILQGILGSIVGGTLIIKIYWSRLIAWLKSYACRAPKE